jgi:hypothetical protein
MEGVAGVESSLLQEVKQDAPITNAQSAIFENFVITIYLID